MPGGTLRAEQSQPQEPPHLNTATPRWDSAAEPADALSPAPARRSLRMAARVDRVPLGVMRPGGRAVPVHRKALSLVLAGGVLLSGCVAAPSGGVEPPPAPQRASGSPAKGLASEDPSRPFDADPPDRSAEAQSRCDDTGAGADTVIASIPLPHRPVDLVLDARTSTLYTSSERGDVVSVVDTSSRAVVSTISLRDRPYALFVDASRGSLFATLAAAQAPGGSIAVIDTVRNTPVRSIPFPDARWPTDAVVD